MQAPLLTLISVSRPGFVAVGALRLPSGGGVGRDAEEVHPGLSPTHLFVFNRAPPHRNAYTFWPQRPLCSPPPTKEGGLTRLTPKRSADRAAPPACSRSAWCEGP